MNPDPLPYLFGAAADLARLRDGEPGSITEAEAEASLDEACRAWLNRGSAPACTEKVIPER